MIVVAEINFDLTKFTGSIFVQVNSSCQKEHKHRVSGDIEVLAGCSGTTKTTFKSIFQNIVTLIKLHVRTCLSLIY